MHLEVQCYKLYFCQIKLKCSLNEILKQEIMTSSKDKKFNLSNFLKSPQRLHLVWRLRQLEFRDRWRCTWKNGRASGLTKYKAPRIKPVRSSRWYLAGTFENETYGEIIVRRWPALDSFIRWRTFRYTEARFHRWWFSRGTTWARGIRGVNPNVTRR